MVDKNIPTYSICNLLNEEKHKEDFIILDLNKFLHFQPSLVSSPHKHHFYQLLFITEGAGVHFIDFKNYDIERGELYILSPGQIHKWLFEPTTRGFVINFTSDFFDSFLMRPDYLRNFSFFIGNGNNSHIKMNTDFDFLDTIFSKIYEEYRDKENGNLDLIRVYLLELFLVLKKELGKQSDELLNNRIQLNLLQHFDQLIEENYVQKRLPKEYANLLSVTPNHLNAVCKQIRGISAGEMIRNRVLLESKRLLANSPFSISEIAYQLNFADHSYFSRFFKKHTGKTPENFRKNKHEIVTL